MSKKGTLEETSNGVIDLETMTDMKKEEKKTWLLQQMRDLWQAWWCWYKF